MSFEPSGYMAFLQVSLLSQIIQNFLQNALKFTPKDKSVTLRSSQNSYGLLIEVIDEGCGIDESSDLFAPFKREGNKPGVGLGLFLAKSAADALGAKISIKNRILIITDAEKGSFGYYKNEKYFQEAIKPEKIIDTTGGGDAYTAGFIAEYLKTKNIKFSMESGAKYAAEKLSRIGAN